MPSYSQKKTYNYLKLSNIINFLFIYIMESSNRYSLSDIASLMDKRSDGFLEGNGIIILILFFLIFGFNGNGFGFGNNGSLTRAELSQGFADNQVLNGIKDLRDGLCETNANLTNSINNSNIAMLNGFNNTNTTLLNGFNGIEKSINQLGYQNQQCCCEIKNAIHSEGETTRALIQQNLIQTLRDKLADKDREITAAQLVIQNTGQTRNILDSLGNYYPKPGCIPTPYYNNTNLL